jgi:polysaccharide pyruvyl transferase WcaK-like protein
MRFEESGAARTRLARAAVRDTRAHSVERVRQAAQALGGRRVALASRLHPAITALAPSRIHRDLPKPS